MTAAPPGRWTQVHVDLDAVAHNVGVLRTRVSPAAVWAVVKANGYGHGSIPVARTVLRAGAEGLCVALTAEGVELREADIDTRILVLSQQPPGELDALVEHRLIPTVYSLRAVEALTEVVRRHGLVGYPIHVKVDTGMHRAGAAPADVPALVAAIERESPTLRLAGIFTHFAVADQPENPFTDRQLQTFESVVSRLPVRPPDVHAANSAAALTQPAARLSFVRAGITVYGLEPGPGVGFLCTELRPALSLVSRVSHVMRVPAGDGVSYGLRHTFTRDSTVATVPIGYADGVPRRMGNQREIVLIGGRRRDIVGVVTMDQLMVDCGDDQVAFGDEVVLVGRQGAEEILVREWAQRLDTIDYEVVCGISRRVPRLYHGGA